MSRPSARPAAAPAVPGAPLDGALAVITGASGGLGSACALALAAAGASLALLARRRDPLLALADRVEDAGGRAVPVACDVADPEALARALQTLPPPQILVTCAGGNRPAPFLDASVEDLDWMLRVNVRSAFVAAQAVARRMVEAGRGGRIVHMTSQMGHVGAPGRTGYCAAKHAVEGLTRASAVELAPHGIRVNAVAPTFVETPMTRAWLEDDGFRSAVVERIPLGRLGTAEEVAAAVLFAASRGSSLVTGATLHVDGGWTAQ
jgi:NAD(P)-dependent dehydrogenase (short-subunit alcohol dehydrogenase family)